MGAAINIPMFKVRMELTGVLQLLWRDSLVARAISNFGIYLGSMPAADPSLHIWTAVVAVDNLCRIPYEITMVASSLEHDIQIEPIDWAIGPVYKREDLSSLPQKFGKPTVNLSSPAVTEDDDMVHVPRKTLQRLCSGVDHATLSLPVREALAGANSMMSHVGVEN